MQKTEHQDQNTSQKSKPQFQISESIDRLAHDEILVSRRARVRHYHAEVDISVVRRLLPVHDGDHAVGSRVTSLVLRFVSHDGKFEIRGVRDLLLRVGAFFELLDHIGASAVVGADLVRVDLCAVVGACYEKN